MSPDDQQIAIAEINEQSDVANDTSKGYIEDLVGGGNQVSLWNNSGTYALRWPAGWDGSSLIDEVASGRCGGPACGGNSYHVVDPSTGDATAAVCQTPSSQPSWGTPNATITSYSLEGLPTAAGTACFEYADSFNAYGDDTETTSLDSMSWGGASATFTQAQNQYGGLEYNACELSPDGIADGLHFQLEQRAHPGRAATAPPPTRGGRTTASWVGSTPATCWSRSTSATSESSTRPPGC